MTFEGDFPFRSIPPLQLFINNWGLIIGVGVKFTISSLVYGHASEKTVLVPSVLQIESICKLATMKPLAFRSRPCDKNVNFTPTPII